ncbi:MAG TPA: hypothetical protein VIT67_22670, partial [Povalibacter sp.]
PRDALTWPQMLGGAGALLRKASDASIVHCRTQMLARLAKIVEAKMHLREIADVRAGGTHPE